MTLRTPGSLLTTIAVLTLVLTSCDATGPTDTVILSENSPIPPTVEYTFDYETNGNQEIDVRSAEADNLSSILEQNGFRRSDVESARIDSVKIERLSSENALVSPKVFDYLTGATLYLGSGTEGVRIANATLETTDSPVRLPVEDADVTTVVRNGHSNAFLQLSTTSDAPEQRRDRVMVTVYFRLEVRGV